MDENEIIEDYAASQDPEPTVLESAEVVGQRIRDLVEHVKDNLPMFFTNSDRVAVSAKDLLLVLGELDDEFSYSYTHRVMLMALMCRRIADVLQPAVDATAMSEMNRADALGEEVHVDDDGMVSGSVEVRWDSLFPDLPGNLGHLLALAASPVMAYLNATLWEDPSWDTIAEELTLNLDPLLENFYGAVGFLLIIVYVRVLEDKLFPKMTYHIKRF